MATRAPEAMASRAGEAGMLAGIAWAPVAILVYFALQAASRVLAPGGLNLDEAEQMVAVQALDWGYGAQPPLYTWLQIAVFQVTGEGKLGLALL
ncbi:MAG: glycosyltransferase, partial [Pseudomonadota bacterium]